MNSEIKEGDQQVRHLGTVSGKRFKAKEPKVAAPGEGYRFRTAAMPVWELPGGARGGLISPGQLPSGQRKF